jgi:hypothetical protein
MYAKLNNLRMGIGNLSEQRSGMPPQRQGARPPPRKVGTPFAE